MMQLECRQSQAFRPDRIFFSKLLGSIQSPITNFARVINQIAEQGGAA